MRIVLTLFGAWTLMAQEPVPWIVDTDGGTDDYLAIAYLLAKPNVHVEAVASVNGLSGAEAGARTAARLIELSGRVDIPVVTGAARALASQAAFPAEWRKMSEELPGVALPALRGKLEAQSAESYYLARLTKPAKILALGPLTNLAVVLRREPALARNIQELVIMGGALHVPGNLQDGDLFKTNNKWAEWNIFMDPEAARLVFESVSMIKLVPLDATNQVPVRVRHIRDFERGASASALGKFVTQILQLDEPMVKEGYYYAWDPLAAVAAAEPRFGKFVPAAVTVSTAPGEEGRTVPVRRGRPNLRVLAPPRAADFHREFYNTFAAQKKVYNLLAPGGHLTDPWHRIDCIYDGAGEFVALSQRLPGAQVMPAARASN